MVSVSENFPAYLMYRTKPFPATLFCLIITGEAEHVIAFYFPRGASRSQKHKSAFLLRICFDSLTTRDAKVAEFANNVGLDEVAHDEPPHLDLHCLPRSH